MNLYSLGMSLFMVGAAPFYALRVIKGKYRSSFKKRMGSDLAIIPETETGSIWIHACSVGEVEAAVPLVEYIKGKKTDCSIIISTVTETGQARAQALFPDSHVRYLPFDFEKCIHRHFENAGKITHFIILETEIWPNLINELAKRDIPIFIANGRISDKTWPNYRRFGLVFEPIMKKIRAVGARTEIDAQRFRTIGASRVVNVGNIKFDRKEPEILSELPKGKFIFFASTHPGEDEICLRIFNNLKIDFPELRAVIAPRHTERATGISNIVPSSLRSKGWGDEEILILDTHGELAGMYAMAEAAFIGGSFVPIGGHNPLEPAILGVPTLWGPHFANFKDACGLLDGHGGFLCETPEECTKQFARLLGDREYAISEGQKAKEVVLSNRGATEKTWQLFFEEEVKN